MHHRPERLGKLIREELAKFILREFEFPDAVVTLTDVEVTAKLDHAKVKVSVWPTEKSAEVLKSLVAAQGGLQHQLMKKIRMRIVPRVRFEIDYGTENAARVEKVLLDE